MAATLGVDVRDIEYARPDGIPLMARLYTPAGKGPFPGVVEVHGGAWTTNDRLTNEAIHRPLAESGVVVMAIDFRMPPVAVYPASIQDINLAVRWLKANAPDLGVAPEHVGGLGTSSGGHQLALAALRPHDPRYAALPLAGGTKPDARLAFMALCWSIVDPLARYRMVKAKSIERLVAAHDAYWPDEAAMDEGNPQRLLDRGEPAELPPALLIQGTNDDNVTPDMAARFAAAYRKAGGDFQLETFPGEPHAFIARDPNAHGAKRAIALIVDFVHAKTRTAMLAP
ncbi:MAG: alpha/beta hydrolase [Alphaproteobacteria bacterium]|nr:alpha/beta hydrolase [Alphaproteobacteria bacterium]